MGEEEITEEDLDDEKGESDEDVVAELDDESVDEQIDEEGGGKYNEQETKELAFDETKEFATFDRTSRLTDFEIQPGVRQSSGENQTNTNTLFMNRQATFGRSMSDIYWTHF